jgi:four helix bundle protein
MNEQELKDRTKQFALRIIRLVESLPKSTVGNVIGKQLLRSGTSVGANYRAACRGKSKADFTAKLGIVVEESDECCYWLELLIESGTSPKEKVEPFLKEANELTAIFVSSIRTSQDRSRG